MFDDIGIAQPIKWLRLHLYLSNPTFEAITITVIL